MSSQSSTRWLLMAAVVVVMLLGLTGCAPSAVEGEHSRIKRETTAGTLNNINAIVDLLGPRKQVDFVIALGRSIGIGKKLFYLSARKAAEAVIKQYATVHHDYVRTSVLTFARNVTVVYDHVTNGSSFSKCELFNSANETGTAPWDGVAFDYTDQHGCNLKEVIRVARNIFQAGQSLRPSTTQVTAWLAVNITRCCIPT